MKCFKMAAPVLGAILFSTPALALDVSETVEVEASPQSVWSTIGDFCGIADWHPAVTACDSEDVDGTTRRTLTLDGGGTLVEDLVSREDGQMTYTYRIAEGPLPVAGYQSTLSVSGEGDMSTLTWEGSFEAAEGASDDDATATIRSIYAAGLQSIAERAEAM